MFACAVVMAVSVAFLMRDKVGSFAIRRDALADGFSVHKDFLLGIAVVNMRDGENQVAASLGHPTCLALGCKDKLVVGDAGRLVEAFALDVEPHGEDNVETSRVAFNVLPCECEVDSRGLGARIHDIGREEYLVCFFDIVAGLAGSVHLLSALCAILRPPQRTKKRRKQKR